MPTQMFLSLFDHTSALGFEGSVGFHHYSEPLLNELNYSAGSRVKATGYETLSAHQRGFAEA